jgi:hypothetical protein
MEKIEKKYFGKSIEGLQQQSSQISSPSPSLTFHSFAGLFLITGISTLLALFVSETLIFWQNTILKVKECIQRYLIRLPLRVHPNDLDSTQRIDQPSLPSDMV